MAPVTAENHPDTFSKVGIFHASQLPHLLHMALSWDQRASAGQPQDLQIAIACASPYVHHRLTARLWRHVSQNHWACTVVTGSEARRVFSKVSFGSQAIKTKLCHHSFFDSDFSEQSVPSHISQSTEKSCLRRLSWSFGGGPLGAFTTKVQSENILLSALGMQAGILVTHLLHRMGWKGSPLQEAQNEPCPALQLSSVLFGCLQPLLYTASRLRGGYAEASWNVG